MSHIGCHYSKSLIKPPKSRLIRKAVDADKSRKRRKPVTTARGSSSIWISKIGSLQLPVSSGHRLIRSTAVLDVIKAIQKKSLIVEPQTSTSNVTDNKRQIPNKSAFKPYKPTALRYNQQVPVTTSFHCMLPQLTDDRRLICYPDSGKRSERDTEISDAKISPPQFRPWGKCC
jgi:hypothetical protein